VAGTVVTKGTSTFAHSQPQPVPKELLDAPMRLDRLRELLELVAQSHLEPDEEGVLAFVAMAALNGDPNADDPDERAEDRDAVRLMTIHRSKGLEFDCVLLACCEEGSLPMYRADWSEERRLMYVAATRARKQLYLVWRKTEQRDGMYGPWEKKLEMSSLLLAAGKVDSELRESGAIAFKRKAKKPTI
jgi:superfamily I DNA/RNA helicase